MLFIVIVSVDVSELGCGNRMENYVQNYVGVTFTSTIALRANMYLYCSYSLSERQHNKFLLFICKYYASFTLK